MTSTLPLPDQKPFDAAPFLNASPRKFLFFGNAMSVHVDSRDTDGGFSLLEMSAKPGSEPPLHVHDREDEMFYVLEGELTVQRGFETLVLRAGQCGFLPRGLQHTYKITSQHARWLIGITPGGFEEFFRTLSSPIDASEPYKPSIERMLSVAARYGCSFPR